MGKKNDAFLLSDGDRLRLTPQTTLIYRSNVQSSADDFDVVQEKEMQVFSDRYIVTDRLLGSGVFAKVFMAVEQPTRTQLACKIVDLRRIGTRGKKRPVLFTPQKAVACDIKTELERLAIWSDQKMREIDIESKLSAYYREFDILDSMHHPNITSIKKVYISNSTMYILHDLATAGNLYDYMQANKKHITEVEAAILIWQVLVAVQFLHDRNIVHRNLSPDSVMITGFATGARIILMNFGNARRIAPVRRSYLGPTTQQVALPRKRPHTRTLYAQDILCVGVVAVLLLLGSLPGNDAHLSRPYIQRTSSVTLKQVTQTTGWKCLKQTSKEIIQDLLNSQDDDCLTANEALEHAFFSDRQPTLNFEDMYHGVVSSWRPCMAGSDFIDFMPSRSSTIRSFECSRAVIKARESQQSGIVKARNMPIEPPYKPFPRKMHESGGLWPPKKKTRAMSEEAADAIAKNWSPAPIEKSSLPSMDPINGQVDFKMPGKPKLQQAGTFSETSKENLHWLFDASHEPTWTFRSASDPAIAQLVESENSQIDHDHNHGQTEDEYECYSPSPASLAQSPFFAEKGQTMSADRLFRQSKASVAKDTNTPSSNPVEAEAPIPLNTQSRSKLMLRSQSRSRSQSLEPPALRCHKRRYKGSVYDHESDIDTDNVEANANELARISTNDDDKPFDSMFNPSIDETDSKVWIHEEWLRLTQEDTET